MRMSLEQIAAEIVLNAALSDDVLVEAYREACRPKTAEAAFWAMRAVLTRAILDAIDQPTKGNRPMPDFNRPENDPPRPERTPVEELRDWEVLQQNGTDDKTERLKIARGWLYRTATEGGAVAMVFVPDN